MRLISRSLNSFTLSFMPRTLPDGQARRATITAGAGHSGGLAQRPLPCFPFSQWVSASAVLLLAHSL